MWSLRDSYCSGIPHLQRIDEPALIVQSDADTGVFPRDAQLIHDSLASADKRLQMIEGDHYLIEPAGARDKVADIIAAWLEEKA
jgi:esterase/lipase